MDWKNRLKILENEKKWDDAIDFIAQMISNNPDAMDPYLFMNYLLMNLLVEEEVDSTKLASYVSLAERYFSISYKKFNHDPVYLFFTGITAFISEWYFKIDIEQARDMIKQAMMLDSENPLYVWAYYAHLDMDDVNNKKKALYYARDILFEQSEYIKILSDKGALGEFVLGLIRYSYENSI